MAGNDHCASNTQPLIFGEVLYDCFPDGSRVLGGAPFNVAWHLQGFGLAPLLLTRIGQDDAGNEVVERMKAWGMDTCAVQWDAAHPTGTVAITLHDAHHHFHIAAAQAYDYIDRDSAIATLQGRDVGLLYHGTLAVRSVASNTTLHWLRQILQLPTFIDINLRAPWWQRTEVHALLQGAAWAKLNDDELRELVPDDIEPIRAAQQLAARHHISNLVVTRGTQGALLLHDHQVYDCPAAPVSRLIDTVGAGDAFSAVMLYGLARRWDTARMLRNAASFAAALCARRGATVFEPDFYKEFINRWEE